MTLIGLNSLHPDHTHNIYYTLDSIQLLLLLRMGVFVKTVWG